MAKRLLEERTLVVRGEADSPSPGASRLSSPASGRGVKSSGRSVTVNLAESPLGWLKARGHISGRQYDAGEQCAAIGNGRSSRRR
jgi:hypothetical protein